MRSSPSVKLPPRPSWVLTFAASALAGGTAFAVAFAISRQAPVESPTGRVGIKVERRPGQPDEQRGMVWLPPGDFVMGGDDGPASERPAHLVHVDGFWIDRHEVTNGEFARFVAATGYVTTAERPVDWEELRKQLPAGTPKPEQSQLVPGSLVFTPPEG